MTEATLPKAIRNPQLIARFEARRETFLRSLRRFKRGGTADDEKIEDICSELHKLGGVASLFGSREITKHANDYQAKLRRAPLAERPVILKEMLQVFSESSPSG